MGNDFIGRQIRRCNRYLFLTSLGLFLVPISIANPNPTQFTGTLVNFTSRVRQEILDRIEAKSPKFRGTWLPLLLEETQYSA